jgi:hypothetical protein
MMCAFNVEAFVLCCVQYKQPKATVRVDLLVDLHALWSLQVEELYSLDRESLDALK